MPASPTELLQRVIALHNSGDIDEAEFERLTVALLDLAPGGSAQQRDGPARVGDVASRRYRMDAELSQLKTLVEAFGEDASPAQQRYLDSRFEALGQEAAQLNPDAALVDKSPPVRPVISAPGQCGNCGGYRVTNHKSQQGDVMTASVLTTLGVTMTAGGFGLLSHSVSPVVPVGIVIAIVVGFLGVICARAGYRERPMGPVRTTYTCDLCGYAWEAGHAPPARPNPVLLKLAEEEQRRRANNDAVAIIDYERHRRR